MKIGFFGNTNNYPFMLARAFKRLGAEVSFFVNSSSPLHRPEYCYSDICSSYPEWIHDVSSMRMRHYVVPNRRHRHVVRELNTCAWVFLNGLGVSLGAHIDTPDMALLTGQDLTLYCNQKYPDSIEYNGFLKFCTPVYRMLFRRLVDSQRKAVKQSDYVSYFPEGIDKQGDQILRDLSVDKARRFNVLMIDDTEYALSPYLKNNVPRLLYASRVSLCTSNNRSFGDNANKGTDIFLRAIKKYHEKYEAPLTICMVKKGPDVDKAMALAYELGIHDKIMWLEEMTQRELVDQMCASDIIADQFGTSMPGMVSYTAMSLGRPVLANARVEVIGKIFPEPMPVCHAVTADDLCDQIHSLVFDPEKRILIGERSRRYVEKYLSSTKWAEKLFKLISNRVHES